MSQNAYDKDELFFNNFSNFKRSIKIDTYMEELLPLSLIKNGKIIDFGCGNGWFCFEAIELYDSNYAIGIDISNNMINKANETLLNKGISKLKEMIKFEIQDLDNLIINDNDIGTFDFAFSAYTIHYLSNLESFFKKVYLLLKSNNNSSFLFSIEHPIKTSTNLKENKFINLKINDDEIEKKVWPLSDYSKEGKRIVNWLNFNGLIKYHYTISTYVNTLIKIGFTIDYLGEWYLDDDKEKPHVLYIKVSKK